MRKPPRTPARLVASLCVLALTVTLSACSSDGDSDSGAGAPAGDATLVAKNIAWDTDSIAATAGQDFVIVVDNQDDGIQHNLDIKETDFRTELEAGPVFQTLTVNLPAGEYDFVCDLHPNMSGTLTAS